MSYIEFPKLWGLKFNINQVALQFGDIKIYWYGVIIAAAFLLAVVLGMRQSHKAGLSPENVIDLVLFGAPVAIIFARLYYVIFSWDSYRDDPLEILKIWHGGLAIYGGLIGGLLVGFVFARIKKIPVLKLFDFAIPYFVLAQSIGRWGNMVNQEAFGTNTSLPWGMTGDQIKYQLSLLRMRALHVNPDMPVHPTFLYESLWDLGVFLFLIWFRTRKKLEGEVLCLYFILYGIGRFFIEGLRLDSLMIGNIRVSQMLSLILVIVFALVFIIRRKKVGAAGVDDGGSETSEYRAILDLLKEEQLETPAPEASNEKGEKSEELHPEQN